MTSEVKYGFSRGQIRDKPAAQRSQLLTSRVVCDGYHIRRCRLLQGFHGATQLTASGRR